MTSRDHSTDVRAEHVMLDLGADAGALVLYADSALHGVEIEISRSGCDHRSHKQVHARSTASGTAFAAVFDRLEPGAYTLWVDGVPCGGDVAVDAAAVTELDWRSR